MKNYGFIPEEPQGDEELFGGSFDYEILQPNHSWENFLPIREKQNLFHETWNCTNFSLLNCLEIYALRKYGMVINKSDRYNGTLSGTVPGYGNTMRRSYESLPNFGWVDESLWPFNTKNVEEYYSKIPQEIIEIGKKSLDIYSFNRRLVGIGAPTPDALYDALMYSPIRVSVHAWDVPKNGVYQRTNASCNHLVSLIKGIKDKSFFAFDHYDKEIKELSWDYYFGAADIVTFDLIEKKQLFKHTFITTMTYGQRSKEVENLQRALKIEGTFPQDMKETGLYGKITAEAVMKFQRLNKVLPELEIKSLAGKTCGPKTRAALNKIFS